MKHEQSCWGGDGLEYIATPIDASASIANDRGQATFSVGNRDGIFAGHKGDASKTELTVLETIEWE